MGRPKRDLENDKEDIRGMHGPDAEIIWATNPGALQRAPVTEKLTDEVIDKIVSAVAVGNYMETAAAFAGVLKVTLYLWLRKGREDREKGKTARTSKYIKLMDGLEQAVALAEMNDLENIGRHALKDWKASAWRLERRNYERWGLKMNSRVEVTGPDGGPLQIHDERDAFLRRIAGLKDCARTQEICEQP